MRPLLPQFLLKTPPNQKDPIEQNFSCHEEHDGYPKSSVVPESSNYPLLASPHQNHFYAVKNGEEEKWWWQVVPLDQKRREKEEEKWWWQVVSLEQTSPAKVWKKTAHSVIRTETKEYVFEAEVSNKLENFEKGCESLILLQDKRNPFFAKQRLEVHLLKDGRKKR